MQVQTQSQERYCLGCDYSLRGLTANRCPECGRVFDPDDPKTFAERLLPHPALRMLGRVIGWPTNAAALVILTLVLISSLYPGGVNSLLMFCAYAWFIILPVFFIRLLAFVLFREWSETLIKRDLLHWKWFVVPVCMLLWIGLVAITDVPCRVFFAVNRPFLDRFTQQVSSLPPGTTLPDQRIGAYPAEKIETFPGGVRFLVRGSGSGSAFYGRYGFAYSPQGSPPSMGDDLYQPIRDGWYLWIEGW